MNVNAKIDWRAGMELTAQTFIELDKCLERNRQITNTVAYGNHFGILPTTAFSCNGVFVKKTLEISPLSFMALMPSGDLLHVDEDVVVNIPILYGKEYYLGCKLVKLVVSTKSKCLLFHQWLNVVYTRLKI